MSLVGQSVSIALTVSISADDLGQFQAGIGSVHGATRRPTTYPIVWLARPEVVTAIRQLAADRPDALPFHELQTIETFSAPPLDRPLTLAVAATRTDADRMTLEGDLADEEGRALVRLHAILRLVS